MVETKDTKHSVALQMLSYVCESVNRVSTKRQLSYKRVEYLIRKLGCTDCKILYSNSYLYEGEFVDVYVVNSYDLIIYSKDYGILGIKVKKSNYACRKFLISKLTGFSVLETKDYIICEKSC